MAYLSSSWLLPEYAARRDRGHKPMNVSIQSLNQNSRDRAMDNRPADMVTGFIIGKDGGGHNGVDSLGFKVLLLTQEDIKLMLPTMVRAGGKDAISEALAHMNDADLVECLALALANRGASK